MVRSVKSGRGEGSLRSPQSAETVTFIFILSLLYGINIRYAWVYLDLSAISFFHIYLTGA